MLKSRKRRISCDKTPLSNISKSSTVNTQLFILIYWSDLFSEIPFDKIFDNFESILNPCKYNDNIFLELHQLKMIDK